MSRVGLKREAAFAVDGEPDRPPQPLSDSLNTSDDDEHAFYSVLESHNISGDMGSESVSFDSVRLDYAPEVENDDSPNPASALTLLPGQTTPTDDSFVSVTETRDRVDESESFEFLSRLARGGQSDNSNDERSLEDGEIPDNSSSLSDQSSHSEHRAGRSDNDDAPLVEVDDSVHNSDVEVIAETAGCIDLTDSDDVIILSNVDGLVVDLTSPQAATTETTSMEQSVYVIDSPHERIPTLDLPPPVMEPLFPSFVLPPVEKTLAPSAIDIGRPPEPQRSSSIHCPICLDTSDEVKDSGRQLVSTTCGHIFCQSCLDKSLLSQKQCPKCRKKLTKRQIHVLYV